MVFTVGVLAPYATPKLEDDPLSAARDCLFTYPQLPSVSFTRDLRTRHAVVTRDIPLRTLNGTNIMTKTAVFIIIEIILKI
jgi:hypothetical protein